MLFKKDKTAAFKLLNITSYLNKLKKKFSNIALDKSKYDFSACSEKDEVLSFLTTTALVNKTF